jgi:hypothetical protein
MKNIIIGLILAGFNILNQTVEFGVWHFKNPIGDSLQLQNLISKNYSEVSSILIYNGFNIHDTSRTEYGFHQLFLNGQIESFSHILAIELKVKDSQIIQLMAFVKTDYKYYQSWKGDMLLSGYKTSDMFINMEGKSDEFFNEDFHAVYIMSDDLNPFFILYSSKTE